MPIYAYRCESCGHAQDVLQKISDPLLTVCPTCGADSFRKQLTAAGFQLKGSGWYVTDFRNGSKPAGGPEAPKDKPAAGGGAAESAPPAVAPATAPAAPSTDNSSGGSSAAAGGCGTSCACH